MGQVQIALNAPLEPKHREKNPIARGLIMFQAEQSETEWKPLYRLGGAAALILVAIIPIAVIVFIALPPPSFQPTSSAVID